MYLDSTKKKEIFSKFGGSETNTGSVEGQVALFSFRISHLTEHLKKNRKDYGTQRALQLLVGKRRSLLDYLKSKDSYFNLQTYTQSKSFCEIKYLSLIEYFQNHLNRRKNEIVG